MVTTKDIMSGNTTRTIVITTSSGNVPKLVTVNASAVEDIFSDDGGGPRKRRRLTNLTPEEKMLRRKLKNRVAAQTARDRKKELMGTLEQQVTRLMDQNKRLQDENKKLKTQSSSLITENQHLKERLGQPGSLAERKSESSGSAVSFDLLPWGQTQKLSQSMMPYATSVLTMSLCLALFSRSAQNQTQMVPVEEVTLQSSLPKEIPPKSLPTLAWWGPHQQSWNPSMNS